MLLRGVRPGHNQRVLSRPQACKGGGRRRCSSWLPVQGPLQTALVLVKETDLITGSCWPKSWLWGSVRDGWFCERTAGFWGLQGWSWGHPALLPAHPAS